MLTVSHRDRKTGQYTMEKAPCYHLVGEDEEQEAGATDIDQSVKEETKVLEPAQ